MRQQEHEDGTRSRSVASRISAILTTFAGRSNATMTEVARQAHLPVSTAHRLMNELLAHGLLERDAEGVYHVGAVLHRLAGGSASPAVDAVLEIGETLEELGSVTGSRARFASLRGCRVEYLELGVEPLHLLRAPASAPAHATAAGKALLAHAGRDVVARVIGRGLTRYTSRTIVTAGELEQELALVRRRGVAVARGEWQEAHCAVAAPVRERGGRLLGALELLVPDAPGVLRAAGPALVVTACGTARRLAGSSGGLIRELGEVPLRPGPDAALLVPARGRRQRVSRPRERHGDWAG